MRRLLEGGVYSKNQNKQNINEELNKRKQKCTYLSLGAKDLKQVKLL